MIDHFGFYIFEENKYWTASHDMCNKRKVRKTQNKDAESKKVSWKRYLYFYSLSRIKNHDLYTTRTLHFSVTHSFSVQLNR